MKNCCKFAILSAGLGGASLFCAHRIYTIDNPVQVWFFIVSFVSGIAFLVFAAAACATWTEKQ